MTRWSVTDYIATLPDMPLAELCARLRGEYADATYGKHPLYAEAARRLEAMQAETERIGQMSERCICEDYELRGKEYEIWTDGTRGSGGYPNWWLSGGHKPGWVLTGDDFEPKLTGKEIGAISEYVYDRLSGG